MNERPHYTKPVTQILRSDCETLIRLALLEDAPNGDPSSESIFSQNEFGSARALAREDGTFCGRAVLEHLLEIDKEINNSNVSIIRSLNDGDCFKKGDIILELKGKFRNILRLERIILNFIQYLSSISTNVTQALSNVDKDIAIVDTRKTLPGYRKLAKYAAYVAGGTNHRIDLSSMVMIKDNHIAASGGIALAAKRVREKRPDLPLEIEVDNLEQIPEALECRPKVILLDNMDRKTIEKAIQIIQGVPEAERPFIEVSGGWTPDRLSDLNGLGRLGVSMGYLTHTTRFVNMTMEVDRHQNT